MQTFTASGKTLARLLAGLSIVKMQDSAMLIEGFDCNPHNVYQDTDCIKTRASGGDLGLRALVCPS